MAEALDLSKPLNLRAEMVRAGLTLHQLACYDDPERGYVNPLNERETQIAVRSFMHRLFDATLVAGSPLPVVGNQPPDPEN